MKGIGEVLDCEVVFVKRTFGRELGFLSEGQVQTEKRCGRVRMRSEAKNVEKAAIPQEIKMKVEYIKRLSSLDAGDLEKPQSSEGLQ